MAAKSPLKPRKRSDDIILSSQFSPLNVSPGRSPIHGTLTGIPRKVKDSCADWYNLVDKWNELNRKGSTICGNIANVKLEAVLNLDDPDAEKSDNSTEMPLEMEGFISKLESVLSSMKHIVGKMRALTTSLDGIVKLESSQHNDSICQEPLFQTWTTEKFGEESEKLVQMYEKELKLKQELIANIAHVRQRDTMMFFTSAWLHQPYIDAAADIIVESMLHETGHRT